jgi:hypothetical protein
MLNYFILMVKGFFHENRWKPSGFPQILTQCQLQLLNRAFTKSAETMWLFTFQNSENHMGKMSPRIN